MRSSVRAILWTKTGLLLVKRVRDGEPPYFVFPGGGVEDFDEGLETALRRELHEELSVDVERVLPRFVVDRTPDGIEKVEHFYECYTAAAPTSFAGDEAQNSERGAYLPMVIETAAELKVLNAVPREAKQLVLARATFAFDPHP